MSERIGLEKDRVLAAIIDGVTITVISIILGTLLSGIFGGPPKIEAGDDPAKILSAALAAGATAMRVQMLSLALACIPFMLWEMRGSSLGKMVMGLRIAGEDGSDAGAQALIKRVVIKQAGNLINVVYAILGIGLINTIGILASVVVVFGGIYFLLKPEKQSLHDKLSGTAIYRSSGPKGMAALSELKKQAQEKMNEAKSSGEEKSGDA